MTKMSILNRKNLPTNGTKDLIVTQSGFNAMRTKGMITRQDTRIIVIIVTNKTNYRRSGFTSVILLSCSTGSFIISYIHFHFFLIRKSLLNKNDV